MEREGVREEVKDVREEGGVGREGVREEVKDVREEGGVGREVWEGRVCGRR